MVGVHNDKSFTKWDSAYFYFTFRSLDGKIVHKWENWGATKNDFDTAVTGVLEWQTCKKSIPSLKIPAG